MHDPRLERIMALIPPDDALWLSERLEPRWRQRARRLDMRNTAITRVLELLLPEAGSLHAAARTLESALRSQRITAPGELGAVLREIAMLNENRPLGWRQICSLQKSTGAVANPACHVARHEVSDEPKAIAI
ncbi:MAG: hypothetical protein JOY71_18915 [Acetobacteraceae bacterium]|nr:hypothetical protein [Acetobacteraceae bacterium]